jgi:hypothetical protein
MRSAKRQHASDASSKPKPLAGGRRFFTRGGGARSVLLHRPIIAACLIAVLGACAARAPYTAVKAPSRELPEATAKRLVGAWQQQLNRYIAEAGGGDAAVLLQTRALRHREALRPAQVTFHALDVQASVPDRDGWDVKGVLVGRHPDGDHAWLVFLVAIVERERYRPVALQDMRLVTVSAQGTSRAWGLSPANPQAVQRYRERQRAAEALGFPGELDRFELSGAGAELSVREVRSGAGWSMRLGETVDSRLRTEATGKSGRS